MTYVVNGKTLELDSGALVKFEFRILEAIELEGVVIVCLDVPQNRRLNENVFAVSADGAVLWQVRCQVHLIENSPYIGVSVAGPHARLFNADGMVYDVDPKTGEVVSSYFGK